MVMLRFQSRKGRGVDDVVIGRVVQNPIHPVERLGKDLGSLLIEGGIHMLITGVMGFGKNPCLKGKSRSKRSHRDEGIIFEDEAALLLNLLADDITEDAPVFIIEIIFRPLDLFNHSPGDDGESDDLGVGMFQRSPCCHSMVLKYENISEPLIILEIGNPVSVGCQDMCYPLERHGGQGFMVAGCFNDHLVGPDSVHLVVDPLAFTI
jgi:hypothetical protein